MDRLRKQTVECVSTGFVSIKKGTDPVNIKRAKEEIKEEPLADIDYIEMYELPGLRPVSSPLTGRNLLALAVRFGTTRLIDNIILEAQ